MVQFADAARRPRPDRVPARLRHLHGQAALPGLRRLDEQPAAPVRGLRHLRHEGGAQRGGQPVDPRRLVGRVVRPGVRLGDPLRRGRRRPRPPRRPRGARRCTTSSRTRSSRGSTTRLRRAAAALDPDDPGDRRRAGPEGAGLADGARLRDQAVRPGRGVDPCHASPAGGAEALAGWKQRVRDAWCGRRGRPRGEPRRRRRSRSATKIHVSALVRLGAADARRHRGAAGHRPGGLRRPAARAAGSTRSPPASTSTGVCAATRAAVEARRAGAIGYTVRVVPHHPLLASMAEMGLAALPSGLASPPSA